LPVNWTVGNQNRKVRNQPCQRKMKRNYPSAAKLCTSKQLGCRTPETKE
jgi:hypothetical protein